MYLLYMHKYTFTMFLSTFFAFLSLSSFTNSSTHQYKSVSALPTVTVYVRYTTILATLYMIVKILWVFMTSPISTFHISSKNAIHLSWISHRVLVARGNFSFRLFDLFVKTSTSISLSIAPCMSGNVFQENAKSLCHSPVNKIFAFPFAKRPKNFSLSVWVDNTCRWSTPLTSPPLPAPRSCCGHSSSSRTFNVSHLKMHGTVRLNGRATIKCYDRRLFGWQHI